MLHEPLLCTNTYFVNNCAWCYRYYICFYSLLDFDVCVVPIFVSCLDSLARGSLGEWVAIYCKLSE